MPNINLYNLEFKGGVNRNDFNNLSSVATDTVSQIKYNLNKESVQLVNEHFNNPYEFAVGMSLELSKKITAMREHINVLGDSTPVVYKELYDSYSKKLNTYLDVVGGFKEDNKTLLSNYAFVYTPGVNGHINNVEIAPYWEVGKDARPTDVKILPLNEKNKSFTLQKDVNGDLGGMKLYLRRKNIGVGDAISVGGANFVFSGNSFQSQNNPNQILKASMVSPLNRPIGSFVKDSHGKMYYVNSDRRLSRVVPAMQAALGKNDKLPSPQDVSLMTPAEENNLSNVSTRETPDFWHQYFNTQLEQARSKSQANNPVNFLDLFSSKGRTKQGEVAAIPSDFSSAIKSGYNAFESYGATNPLVRGIQGKDFPGSFKSLQENTARWKANNTGSLGKTWQSAKDFWSNFLIKK